MPLICDNSYLLNLRKNKMFSATLKKKKKEVQREAALGGVSMALCRGLACGVSAQGVGEWGSENEHPREQKWT